MAGEPKTIVIGALASCDIRIPDDPYVSARHCQITRDGSGAVWVADLGSMNGTYLERAGQRIQVTVPTQVQPGDVLQVGRTAVPLWRPREPIRVQAEVVDRG